MFRLLVTRLAIIVAGDDRDRARTALSLATCAAALGRGAAMLFDGASVACLADPALADALATARDLGVALTACASGLADTGAALPPGIASGGMMGFLSDNRDAQLVTV